MGVNKTKFMYWVVRRLPKTLVYFCGMYIVSQATSGKHSDVIVPDIRAMDALKIWEEDHLK